MIELRAVDAVPVRLPDGRTLRFRMTWAAVKRASEALNMTPNQLFQEANLEGVMRLIYESLEERDQMTFEQFADTVGAANLPELVNLFKLLTGQDEAGKEPSASG